MGKRGRGRGGGRGGGGEEDGYGEGGGGFSDQYGEGWSGGDRSTESHGPGRGGKGGGGAGGGPRSSAKGSNVVYQRVVPKFLQGHEDMMRGGSSMDAAKQAWNDHDQAEALRGYGDSDDEDAAARKGLGARSDGKGGKAALMAKALGTEGGLEALPEEERAELAKAEKGKGNRAFQDKRYNDAVGHFTVCLKLDNKENHEIYHSNRSAAHACLKQWDKALHDAMRAVELKPQWAKAYARLGAAHMGLEAYVPAQAAYERAAELDPANSSYQAYAEHAVESEAKARAEGNFTFKRTAKVVDGAMSTEVPARKKRKVVGERAGAVKKPSMLSFDEDD